jgi:nitrite reductase (NADH) small subunit
MPSTDSHGKEESVWVPAGTIEQIPVGQGRCVLTGARQIALFRLRSGEVYALDAVCPHRGGPLAEGLVGRETVICPLHAFKFSLRDGRGLDNDFSVKSYPVELRDGNLFVGFPAGDGPHTVADGGA